MLDLKLIEEKPDFVKAALAKKGWDFDPAPVLKLISERRDLLKEVEANKAEQNKLSASVPSVKKAGGNVQEIFAKVRELAAQNKDKEVKLAQVEKDMQALVEVLPNMPDPDLVGGGKENNHPIYHFGKEPTFDGFKPKDHVELEESLGLIDIQAGRQDLGLRLLDVHRSRRPARVGFAQLLHRSAPCRWLYLHSSAAYAQ
jgi:seryl-tRNA synthetase